MANNLRGEVEIKASGGLLIFRLGINEMISVQNDLGLAEDDQGFLNTLDNMRSLKKIRTIVLNGLKRDHPAFTEEMAGDLITELGIERMVEIIKQALRWALPDKEAADTPKKGGKPRPSLGPAPR
jgi:hypothetical protein